MVTMIKNICFVFLSAWLCCWSAHAAENSQQATSFPTEMHLNEAPPDNLKEKAVFVKMKGSPKGSVYIRNLLSNAGFNVVDSRSDATAEFLVDGMFISSGNGKADFKSRLGDIFEAGFRKHDESPDYKYQNVDVPQLAAVAAGTGALSVADLVTWIGQKTGVTGRFNEMISGDPRGFCWHESCSKYTNVAILSVTGNSGYWWIKVSAVDSNIIIDKVVNTGVVSVLKPILSTTKPD